MRCTAGGRRLTSAERGRVIGFGGGVLLLHLLGWGLFWFYSRDHPALGGLGALAYMFGLRHAPYVDHIAAIDNTTRKFLQDGKRPLGVGFFFSLGHSTVVFSLAAALALAAQTINKHEHSCPSELGRVRRRDRLGHLSLDHRHHQPARPRRCRSHPRRGRRWLVRPPAPRTASTRPRPSEQTVPRQARITYPVELADVSARPPLRAGIRHSNRGRNARARRRSRHPRGPVPGHDRPPAGCLQRG